MNGYTPTEWAQVLENRTRAAERDRALKARAARKAQLRKTVIELLRKKQVSIAPANQVPDGVDRTGIVLRLLPLSDDKSLNYDRRMRNKDRRYLINALKRQRHTVVKQVGVLGNFYFEIQ